MIKTKKYIYSLGCKIQLKRWDAINSLWVFYDVKPIWNTRHFAIVPNTYLKNLNERVKGLAHLPSQEVVAWGFSRPLRKIAEELDDVEYTSYSLSSLPDSVKNNILNHIRRNVNGT